MATLDDLPLEPSKQLKKSKIPKSNPSAGAEEREGVAAKHKRLEEQK